jgi:hypothetical protein
MREIFHFNCCHNNPPKRSKRHRKAPKGYKRQKKGKLPTFQKNVKGNKRPQKNCSILAITYKNAKLVRPSTRPKGEEN